MEREYARLLAGLVPALTLFSAAQPSVLYIDSDTMPFKVQASRDT
jgi:hypothetical protein